MSSHLLEALEKDEDHMNFGMANNIFSELFLPLANNLENFLTSNPSFLFASGSWRSPELENLHQIHAHVGNLAMV